VDEIGCVQDLVRALEFDVWRIPTRLAGLAVKEEVVVGSWVFALIIVAAAAFIAPPNNVVPIVLGAEDVAITSFSEWFMVSSL